MKGCQTKRTLFTPCNECSLCEDPMLCMAYVNKFHAEVLDENDPSAVLVRHSQAEEDPFEGDG